MKRFKVLVYLMIVYVSVVGWGAYAQEVEKGLIDEGFNPDGFNLLVNPLSGIGVNSLSDFLSKATDLVVALSAPVVALAIMYSGFLFVVAQGNKEKIEKAKRVLKYTLIGAFIVLGSYVIAEAVVGTINSLK